MKNNVASDEAQAANKARVAWVPHMVARLGGYVQPWTKKVLTEAAAKLIEALRSGRCESEG